MTKVLIVDDEPSFCEQLEFFLKRRGYEVRTAISGREAIDLGCQYRPEVLVVDWMLKNHIHGLHVSDALRAISPNIKTILITGFASRDLQSAARMSQIGQFVEKPLDPQQLEQMIENKPQTPTASGNQLAIAVVELNNEGEIRYANPRARELFGQTNAGADIRRFQDLFGPGRAPDLTVAEERWEEVIPPSSQLMRWHLRARSLPSNGGRMVIIRPTGQPYLENLPVVRMLLGLGEPTKARWPFQSHALIVAENELVRQVIANTLRSVDCVCHSADSQATALRLFQSDPAIGVVVIHSPENRATAQFIDDLKNIREQVVVVRNDSAEETAEDHAVEGSFDPGANLVGMIYDLLSGRIGVCEQCRLPLLIVEGPDEPLGRRARSCSCTWNLLTKAEREA